MTTTRKKSSSSYGTVSNEEDVVNNVDLESQNRSISPSTDTSTKGKKIAMLAFSAAAVTFAVVASSKSRGGSVANIDPSFSLPTTKEAELGGGVRRAKPFSSRGFSRGAASSVKSSSLPKVNAGFARMRERFAEEHRREETETIGEEEESFSADEAELAEAQQEEKRPAKTAALGGPRESQSSALALPSPAIDHQPSATTM